MSYFTGKQLYLSGPIEHDVAENWRALPKKVLKEEFGFAVFDPAEDPKQQWAPLLKQAQENKDYDEMERIAKDFVHKDLSIVDESAVVIAYLPYRVPTTGTVHEIINSNNAKKPTMIICPQGKQFVPLWYRGFIRHQFTFGSWEDCFVYLREVNAGLHKDNRRWARIYGLV